MKIDTGDMIILDSIVFIITEMDYDTGYGEFKHFKNQKDAEKWLDKHKNKETDKGLN